MKNNVSSSQPARSSGESPRASWHPHERDEAPNRMTQTVPHQEKEAFGLARSGRWSSDLSSRAKGSSRSGSHQVLQLQGGQSSCPRTTTFPNSSEAPHKPFHVPPEVATSSHPVRYGESRRAAFLSLHRSVQTLSRSSTVTPWSEKKSTSEPPPAAHPREGPPDPFDAAGDAASPMDSSDGQNA